MKKYFRLSPIKSYVYAGTVFLIFFVFFVLFVIKTINLSFWFVFLVMLFLLCLVINYQIFKSIFNRGIKIENKFVHLSGLGVDDKNKFHINEIKSIELHDSKKNPMGSQEFHKLVNIYFFLKSRRVKRLELMELKNSQFIKIKEYFENTLLNE